jgi:hypothetical protein
VKIGFLFIFVSLAAQAKESFFYSDLNSLVPEETGWRLSASFNLLKEFFYHANYSIGQERLLGVSVYGLSSYEKQLKSLLVSEENTNTNWQKHNLIGFGFRERLMKEPFRLDASVKYFQGSSSKLFFMGLMTSFEDSNFTMGVQYIKVSLDALSSPAFFYLPERFDGIALYGTGHLNLLTSLRVHGQLGLLPVWRYSETNFNTSIMIEAFSLFQSIYASMNAIWSFGKADLSLGCALLKLASTDTRDDILYPSLFLSTFLRLT